MAAILIPLGLAILMVAVGLETRVRDFRALVVSPGALAFGLAVQFLGLPSLALALASVFALPASQAIGLVLLAAAPVGVTANYVTLMARGDVALSVTATVATSLAAPLTVPIWIGVAFATFADETVTLSLPFGPALAAIFLTTVVPLLVGVGLAARRPAWADRVRPHVRRLSTGVFLAIVTAAIVVQWPALRAHGLAVGPAALTFDLVATAAVIAAARLAGAMPERCTALATTTGLRNVAVALTVAITLLDRPEVAVTATVYVLVMNAVALALVAFRRARLSEIKDQPPTTVR